jgi:hypothetical protein
MHRLALIAGVFPRTPRGAPVTRTINPDCAIVAMTLWAPLDIPSAKRGLSPQGLPARRHKYVQADVIAFPHGCHSDRRQHDGRL